MCLRHFGGVARVNSHTITHTFRRLNICAHARISNILRTMRSHTHTLGGGTWKHASMSPVHDSSAVRTRARATNEYQLYGGAKDDDDASAAFPGNDQTGTSGADWLAVSHKRTQFLATAEAGELRKSRMHAKLSSLRNRRGIQCRSAPHNSSNRDYGCAPIPICTLPARTCAPRILIFQFITLGGVCVCVCVLDNDTKTAAVPFLS